MYYCKTMNKRHLLVPFAFYELNKIYMYPCRPHIYMCCTTPEPCLSIMLGMVIECANRGPCLHRKKKKISVVSFFFETDRLQQKERKKTILCFGFTRISNNASLPSVSLLKSQEIFVFYHLYLIQLCSQTYFI